MKVVRQEDVARTGRGDGVHVVKLHGDAAAPEGIVLCRDDYDEFFDRRPAMALMLEGLLLNQTFFFIGYGLRDPNFRQVYSRVARMLKEARRPAYATSFESAGEAGRYIDRQWREKQLHLIGVPGSTPAGRERQLLLFLDGLADRVASRAPRLFLAPDVEGDGPLARLRGVLTREVGAEMEALCHGGPHGQLSGQDVRRLASVLRFLADHGWRPRGRGGPSLSRLWVNLASLTPGVEDRRRLLIAALDAAEGSDEVTHIRGGLAALDGGIGPAVEGEPAATPGSPPRHRRAARGRPVTPRPHQRFGGRGSP